MSGRPQTIKRPATILKDVFPSKKGAPMSIIRKIRRKKVREFSYEHYSKVQAKRNKQRRYRACIARMQSTWKEQVAAAVPVRLQVLSLSIPPRWYVNTMKKIFNNMPPEKFTRWVVSWKCPQWVKWMFLGLPWCIGVLADVVGIRPFLHLRRFVRTFGTTTKFKLVDENTMRMTIKYWGTVIYEGDWKM
jgi:hypothetical protein